MDWQRLKNCLWHWPKSWIVSAKYGFPAKKLKVIGITGTDGKTTTCTLIYEILKKAKLKTGLATTIGAIIGDKVIDTGLHMTSPDPRLLQRLLFDMVKAGMEYVVLEVTAHAIDQYRVSGIKFEISGVTNISHEHLDYFKTMERYVLTKTKLLEKSNVSIINMDDPKANIFLEKAKGKVLTYGINRQADLKAKDVKIDETGLNFKANSVKVVSDTVYEYQVYNMLLAWSVAKQLGIDDEIVLDVFRKFPEMKGRREEVVNDLGIRTIIDFAHTPQAIESTLTSLKKISRGKLIIIFGATGGRDKSKRPLMGQVVSRLADIAIVTADDTRNEKVENINDQIIEGMKKGFEFYNIPNRQDAFNKAIQIAKKGDTIVACGKGHETTILHGNTEYPWSEADAFRRAFKK